MVNHRKVVYHESHGRTTDPWSARRIETLVHLLDFSNGLAKGGD